MKKKKLFTLIGSICLILVLAALLLPACAKEAPAPPAPAPEVEVFPAKPVTLIVPFSPGGGTDRVARVIAGTWGTYSDVPLRIVIMPGGGGAEGTLFVANAKPDGYTIGMSSISTAISVPILRDVGYTADDLVCIVSVAETYTLIVVAPDSPWGTFKEFVAYAKEHPGEVTYGSSGTGGWNHLAMELFAQEAGITFKHVPFDGTGPAQLAVMGRHIDSVSTTMGAGVPPVKAGTLRGLAVSSVERVEGVDVPTFREAGFDFEFISWRGIMGPKGIPKEVIEALERTIEQVIEDEGFLKGMSKLGELPKLLSAEEFGVLVAEQTEALRPAVEAIREGM